MRRGTFTHSCQLCMRTRSVSFSCRYGHKEKPIRKRVCGLSTITDTLPVNKHEHNVWEQIENTTVTIKDGKQSAEKTGKRHRTSPHTSPHTSLPMLASDDSSTVEIVSPHTWQEELRRASRATVKAQKGKLQPPEMYVMTISTNTSKLTSDLELHSNQHNPDRPANSQAGGVPQAAWPGAV
eukprot:SAG11_NODE_4334_length_1944_cov_2.118157_3_plen_181_part_00